MLDPHDRGVLLEALRPPSGYVVDKALATTYSLDLLALLTAPLAFSLYDRLVGRDKAGKPGHLDSFALLEAVRKHSENLVVFCEAGRIARPKNYRQLLAYLEGSVVQARAKPETGSFHPKVWVQRFTAKKDDPVLYRVLCLSRNLTFDRSWDTMLILDGQLQDRTRAISDSRPLAEFVEALPRMSLEPLAPARKAIVDVFADELRRVRFETPDGFESFRFWPMGHDDRKESKPFADTRIQRLLVVSPFVTAGRLKSLSAAGKGEMLVSRLEELDRIPKAVLAGFAEVCVLHDAADTLEVDNAADVADPGDDNDRLLPPAQGLHAKLYVADDGAKAHVWTGSANASDAAFTGNVELLVQLTGPKNRFGVDATLNGTASNGGGGLRSLLGSFVAPDEPVAPSDLDVQVDALLRKANLTIARTKWTATLVATPGPVPGKETYTVTLSPDPGASILPDGCTVRVWPIALPESRAVTLDAGVGSKAIFERCSFQALTSFFAFEVTPLAAPARRATFVVTVTLQGAPDDRASRIVQGLLDDPAKVMRFLRLLLAVDAFEMLDLIDPPGSKPASSGNGSATDDVVPLFESLVRALDREPSRLVAVDRLVRELQSTPEGARLLPQEFNRVWAPLWAAYQSLPQERSR